MNSISDNVNFLADEFLRKQKLYLSTAKIRLENAIRDNDPAFTVDCIKNEIELISERIARLEAK
jgi:hypothetical protein